MKTSQLLILLTSIGLSLATTKVVKDMDLKNPLIAEIGVTLAFIGAGVTAEKHLNKKIKNQKILNSIRG